MFFIRNGSCSRQLSMSQILKYVQKEKVGVLVHFFTVEKNQDVLNEVGVPLKTVVKYLWGGLFLGVILLRCASVTHWMVYQIAEKYPEAIFYIETDEPLVALTIDDAPNPDTTPQILDTLKKYQAHATFFIITDNLKGNEEIVLRMLAEGHEIGNHMPLDEPSADLPFPEFVVKFNLADSLLRQFAPVRWFRPGSAYYSKEMARFIKNDPRGYRLVLGSVYPLDAQIPFSSWASHYVDWSTRPGDIIVLHDGKKRGRRTLHTLSNVLPDMRKEGLRVVTLTTLYEHRKRK